MAALAHGVCDPVDHRLLTLGESDQDAYLDPFLPIDARRASRAAQTLGIRDVEARQRFRAMAMHLPLKLELGASIEPAM